MMQPLPPLLSAHTNPCLSPFLPTIWYRLGGGYELSNSKGNVTRRQLPGEKWPFPGCTCVFPCLRVCVCGCWHGPAGVTLRRTATPRLSICLPQMRPHANMLYFMEVVWMQESHATCKGKRIAQVPNDSAQQTVTSADGRTMFRHINRLKDEKETVFMNEVR